jgi:hypothetical protein
MKWYHFSVEYFEDLRNVNHCEFLIMRRNDDSGKYLLENKLRTWSELKRERALEGDKEKDCEGKDGGKENVTTIDATTLARSTTFEVRRRWGGCPNGCNHDQGFKIQKTLADLVKSDSIVSKRAVGLAVSETDSGASNVSGASSTTATVVNPTPTSTSPAPAPGPVLANPTFNGTANSTSQINLASLVSRRPAAKRFQSQTTDDCDEPSEFLSIGNCGGPQIDVTKARDEVVSSPDGTPSFISVDDRLRSRIKSPNMPPPHQLHVGRDFGGTYSGHSSCVSDGEGEEDSEEEEEGAGQGGAVATPVVAANGSVNGKANTNGDKLKPVLQPSSSSSSSSSSLARPHWQREQSRMGRGARANRLGDHHSSDGEHEADGEQEPGGVDVEPDEESGEELPSKEVADVADEMVDEADEVLSRAEREEMGFGASVY